MSRDTRRAVVAQLATALAGMVCVTVLAVLHDIAGDVAVTVIAAILGIGSTHSAAGLASMARTAPRAAVPATRTTETAEH